MRATATIAGPGQKSSLHEQFHRIADLLTYNPFGWKGSAAEKDFPEVKSQYDKNLIFTCREKDFDKFYDWETNCYIYALGDRSLKVVRLLSTANMGGITEQPAKEIDLKSTIALAERNGLQFTGNDIEVKAGFRPVALFVCEGRDYHWLRLDRKNSPDRSCVWTHKFRGFKPRVALFADGSRVLDPRETSIDHDTRAFVRSADEERYRKYYRFAGFFNVPRDFAIPAESVERHRQWMNKAHHAHMSESWRGHLDRMGLPKSGNVPIPQYG